MNIPRNDALKPRPRIGTAQRSLAPTKQQEGSTDADALKGTPVTTTAPSDGQQLTARAGVAVWEAPEITQPLAEVHGILSDRHLDMFDLTHTGGLNVTVGNGMVTIDQTTLTKSPTPLTLVANSFNRIHITSSGAIANSAAGFPAGSRPLWNVATNATTVTVVSDWRAVFALQTTGGGGGSALTVQEIDGTPLDAAVTIIRVPNGTLTDNGVGDVTLDYTTDAELAAHVAAGDPHTGYALESVVGTALRYNVFNTSGNLDSWVEGAAIASAAALTLGTDGDMFHVTGTTAITSINTPTRQTLVLLIFDSAGVVLTHSSTFILKGAVSYTTLAGDVFIFAHEGSGTWREVSRSIAPFSYVNYVLYPDEAPGVAIDAGVQTSYLHSGATAETAERLYGDLNVAAAGGTPAFTLEFGYGDTDDLDTVASWTTIASLAMAGGKSALQNTMTNATIPANRLIRLNITTVTYTTTAPSGGTFTLRCRRPALA